MNFNGPLMRERRRADREYRRHIRGPFKRQQARLRKKRLRRKNPSGRILGMKPVVALLVAAGAFWAWTKSRSSS